MRQDYESAIDALDTAHRLLASKIPPPRIVTVSGATVFRYIEKSPQQAIVLKLAASISRLRASLVLLDAGYLLEQGAIHRMIDENNEDIWFICLALIKDKWTPHHDQFMTAFFAEEFADVDDVVGTRQARKLVPRRKIRAYLANMGGTGNPHRDLSAAEAIGSVYSGFVHAAAQHILTSYGGSPPRFHLAGLLGTPLMAEHAHDSWNYVFRTLQTMAAGAVALGEGTLLEHVRRQVQVFRASTRRSE